MDRKETAERIKIMQAFVDGKQIEFKDCMGRWCEVKNPLWNWDNERDYRIKSEPKYRPFKDADECWQEMLKHQPFGWAKKTCGNCNFLHIMELYSTGIVINNVDNFGCFKNLIKTYNAAFVETTFADGTPFGIKEK